MRILLTVLAVAFCTLSADAQNKVVRRNVAYGSNKVHRSHTSSKNKIPALHINYANGTLTINNIKYEFARVEAGTFMMGQNYGKKVEDANPQHEVTLTKNFLIGKTEVTQSMWLAIIGKLPYSLQYQSDASMRGPNKPIYFTSWDDCQKFISKLNQITGKNFRLPTEAEWEYAARGGNKSCHYIYSGSNTLDDVAWYGNNSGKHLHDVATKLPNELGIYDMTGNADEWCNDNYVPSYYSTSPKVNPDGGYDQRYTDFKVFRGGDYYITIRTDYDKPQTIQRKDGSYYTALPTYYDHPECLFSLWIRNRALQCYGSSGFRLVIDE